LRCDGADAGDPNGFWRDPVDAEDRYEVDEEATGRLFCGRAVGWEVIGRLTGLEMVFLSAARPIIGPFEAFPAPPKKSIVYRSFEGSKIHRILTDYAYIK
jgi:hypothetical protein